MIDSHKQPLIAWNKKYIGFVPKMMNRHGLIAGATGTGKTVSLQVLAETFSEMGVPVFVSDIKGDFSGISIPGGKAPKVIENVQKFGLTDYTPFGYPVCFWDIFGEQGHPLRTTVSEMGPLLLSRLLNLNDTQYGVLNIIFRVADDNGLLLLDLKDLRSLIEFIGEKKDSLTTTYGNISPASLGAIQRGLLILEEQSGGHFFGEPALNILDFIQTDPQGYGIVNILAADKLMQSPRIYSTFLLWLLSELFEELPEAGDLEKPKLVFLFDEAHLLFNEAPPVLLEKIEQVVRLIRSKGIGIYFITQNPIDIPETVLGQLGNRIQHALRAYTPRDQKAVRSAATTFRTNPAINIEKEITELGVGEALVSFLDEKGIPSMVERAFIFPPRGQIGAIKPDERDRIIRRDYIFGTYENAIDRESAFEIIQKRLQLQKAEEQQIEIQRQMERQQAMAPRQTPAGDIFGEFSKIAGKTITRTISNEIGRQLVRGILGGLFGSGKTRRR